MRLSIGARTLRYRPDEAAARRVQRNLLNHRPRGLLFRVEGHSRSANSRYLQIFCLNSERVIAFSRDGAMKQATTPLDFGIAGVTDPFADAALLVRSHCDALASAARCRRMGLIEQAHHHLTLAYRFRRAIERTRRGDVATVHLQAAE
jgi:hypothetical protein